MGAGSIGGVADWGRGGADSAVRAQGGGVAMPPVAAPADKRFRRAHVKPSGKRRSRLRGAWIAARVVVGLTIVAYAAWRGAALVATAGSLRVVANVTVFGNQRLSTGEVLSLLDGLRGRHILGIELGEWQQRLQSSAWVEEATLRRVLPATIEVRIRERRPMAIGRVASALYLVDANGVVVDEYGPTYADLDLPMVDGLGAAGPGKGDDGRGPRGAGGAGDRRAGGSPGSARQGIADRRQQRARRGGDARGRHRDAAPRRGRRSPSACSSTSISATRCASASRRSTTWICDFLNGCTCGPRRARPSRRRLRRPDGRVERRQRGTA